MAFYPNDKDIAVLEAESDQTLVEWWCFLNGCSRVLCVAENIWSIMYLIESRASLKECLREWNKGKLNGKNFEDWYGQFRK